MADWKDSQLRRLTEGANESGDPSSTATGNDVPQNPPRASLQSLPSVSSSAPSASLCEDVLLFISNLQLHTDTAFNICAAQPQPQPQPQRRSPTSRSLSVSLPCAHGLKIPSTPPTHITDPTVAIHHPTIVVANKLELAAGQQHIHGQHIHGNINTHSFLVDLQLVLPSTVSLWAGESSSRRSVV